MGILSRFRDIMKMNVNALVDKVGDPERTIDDYMRNLNSDLGKVKAETASVLADERRAKEHWMNAKPKSKSSSIMPVSLWKLVMKRKLESFWREKVCRRINWNNYKRPMI